VIFELFTEQSASDPIRVASLSLSEITNPGYYTFNFSPIKNSTNQNYFYNFSIDGPGILETGSAPGNAYLSGAQYINRIAQNSQSSFRLVYSPVFAFLGLVRAGFSWLGFLIAGLFLIGIPGWVALSWLYPPWSSMDWISRLSLALGVGSAFYPVLFLWTNTLGVQLGVFNALLLPIAGLLAIVVRMIRNPHELEIRNRYKLFKRDNNGNDLESTNNSQWVNLLPDLVFLVLILLIIFTRFWPIRNLDAGMWGDSYQHTMISQLLVDNGGLFTNWEPYAQLGSFTYHYGFHSLASSLHWLTNLDVIESTLWMGQLLNVFGIIALYTLAIVIGKNKWAGVIAVLIAGLISPMPMHYVNWGRYTQLAGQVILPAIIIIIWLNLDSKPKNLKWEILIWFGLAGLALTHYRVTIFLILFYISYFLFRVRDVGASRLIKRIILNLVGVIILLIPWIIRIFEGTLPDFFRTQITTAASQVSQAAQELYSVGNISAYLPVTVWILFLISILWGIWQRNQRSNIFILWWFLILLAANPHWLQLPGLGILTNFAVFIAAYIPASVIIGSGIASILREYNILSLREQMGEPEPEFKKQDGKSIFLLVLVSITVILIGFWFVRPRIRDVQPAAHSLLTRPDLRAGDWINQNLPGDAKFLVNSFFAYGGTLVVGSDGGWWLPIITNRDTSQPPLLYSSEQGIITDYVAYINTLVALIQKKGISHPDVLSELRERELTHIYIGQQQGQVNANGPPLIKVNDLINDPNFKLIYNQDRVWMFEILWPRG
jgi:hypothetical protein